MYKSIFIALLLFILNTPCSAQVNPILAAKLDRSLDSMRAKMSIKSLSASVNINATTSWSGAIGISTLSPMVNVNTENTYLIGSVTKPITASYILKLEEKGLLKIEDTIGQYLPVLPFISPKITIKQLLNHTSGLYDVLANPVHQPTILQDVTKIWRPEEIIKTFIKSPKSAPGAKWDYCNTNYFLLDMIIERVTGKPFYQAYREEYWMPLQLNTIAVPSLETFNQPVANVWIDLNGDGVTEDAGAFYMEWRSLNSTAGAAGGYFSTASDIASWMRSYLRGDLHKPESLAKAKTFITASGSQGGLYGLGLMSRKFGTYQAYGHGGDLAYSASTWYFPQLDISISVLGNDSKFTSWTLLPVVEALLKTYNATIITSTNNEQINEVSLHPNPTGDTHIYASLPEGSKIEKALAFNSAGLAQTLNVDPYGRIEIQSLACGVYQIHLFTKEKRYLQQLIKL